MGICGERRGHDEGIISVRQRSFHSLKIAML